jgi:flagellar FliL protein
MAEEISEKVEGDGSQPADLPKAGESETSPSPEVTSQDRRGGRMKKLVLLSGILTGLTGAAFAVTLYVLKPLLTIKGPRPESHAAVTPHPGKIFSLDPAIVNIAGTNGRRYLKATIQIEILDDEKVLKEVQARKALLMDRAIRILSGKPLEDLTNARGLDRLKDEIAAQFRNDLGPDRLRAVYLTEFVIQ